MNISFSSWLKTSNEAQPFRDAFRLSDQMPVDFGLRLDCFNLIQQRCEDAWAKTKRDLSA